MSIVYGDVWDTIITASKNVRRKWVAVSYFTDENLIQFNSEDQLIVNASADALASGSTSAKALNALFIKGVTLYSSANFHGKMFHFGSKVIVGSSNISKNSFSHLNEIIQISEEEDVLKEALVVFNKIIDNSTFIDDKFIQAALQIEVRLAAKQTILEDPTNNSLWKLKVTPKDKGLLRAYFIALIRLQIGELKTDTKFKLWKKAPNLRTHIRNDRIKDSVSGGYELTDIGLKYFKDESQQPANTDYKDFFKALNSGNKDDLPERLKDKTMEILY
jgi:hypothetical protein